MKRIWLISVLPVILVFSCVTEPPPKENAAPAVSETTVVQEQNTPPAPAAPPQETQPAQELQADESIPLEDDTFDPASITEQKFETTKADVKTLIDDLNRIIRARNYNAWLGYLADSYFAKISSEAFLAETTEELYKRDQMVATNLGRDPKKVSKKILRTPRDYFDSVVVPSRSNDRMDDIGYISENHVKAYTIDTRGNRLILYDLELIDNKWMIIN